MLTNELVNPQMICAYLIPRPRPLPVLRNKRPALLYATGARLQGIFQVRPDILTQIPSKEELLVKAEDKAAGR